MPAKKRDRLMSRRHAIATMAGGASFIAAPAIVGAQTPLKISFVQQRSLLYFPVDMMVAAARSNQARAWQGRSNRADIERPRSHHRCVVIGVGRLWHIRGLKLPGAHVVADSREVFGGPLTQITLLATRQTKDKDPTLFKAVANALEESIKLCSADKRAAGAVRAKPKIRQAAQSA